MDWWTLRGTVLLWNVVKNVNRNRSSNRSTRLRKACLTEWGDSSWALMQVQHSGDRERSVSSPQRESGRDCAGGWCSCPAHNPHLCTCISLNWLSCSQSATWTVEIFSAPDVFCVKVLLNVAGCGWTMFYSWLQYVFSPAMWEWVHARALCYLHHYCFTCFCSSGS